MTDTATETAVCTMADIGTEITGEDAQPVCDAINEYLSVFAKPIRRENENFFSGRFQCLNCGRALDGFLRTFRWRIVHGEGQCGECGWPCRGMHYPKDADGQNIFDRGLEIVLQYHPSGVQKKEVSDARNS